MFFLLVRKTLRLSATKENLRQNADLLALSSAVLWLLHPVQTQAVTYIIQRAESLMGLFFLSALLFSSQYFTSKKWSWLVAAAAVSLLAGLTKEVALVLPLMVFFYDRTFISKSFREALKNHRLLYSALSLTWVVMIYLYLTTNPEEKLTAGFGMQGMSPLLYLINQPAVILHYLGTALWPSNLIFDYEWPAVSQLRFLWPSILVLVSWVVVLIAAYRRYRVLSFLLLSSLIILLPSSSVIPLKDLIFEYRIYLSLSCLSIVLVFSIFYLAQRFVSLRSRQAFFISCIAITAIILGGMTYQRNKVYVDEQHIWLDVIRKQPFNARAFNNLGEYWMRQGRDEEAKKAFLQAAALNTSYPDVYANLSTVAGRQGKPEEALEYAKKAIVVSPDFAIAQNNAGSSLAQMGRYAEAVPYFQKTIELGFVEEGVFLNLAAALANSGQPLQAVSVLKKSLAVYPQSQETRDFLKQILSNLKVKKPEI